MNENEFEYNGKKYVAVEDNAFEICENCAFKTESPLRLGCGMLQRRMKIPPCSPLDRKDRRNVHFVEKGKARNESKD